MNCAEYNWYNQGGEGWLKVIYYNRKTRNDWRGEVMAFGLMSTGSDGGNASAFRAPTHKVGAQKTNWTTRNRVYCTRFRHIFARTALIHILGRATALIHLLAREVIYNLFLGWITKTCLDLMRKMFSTNHVRWRKDAREFLRELKRDRHSCSSYKLQDMHAARAVKLGMKQEAWRSMKVPS